MIRLLFDKAKTLSGLRVYRDGVEMAYVQSVTLLPGRLYQPARAVGGEVLTTTVKDEWLAEESGE